MYTTMIALLYDTNTKCREIFATISAGVESISKDKNLPFLDRYTFHHQSDKEGRSHRGSISG